MSLSGYLNLIDVRSLCWRLVEMRSSGNFRVPTSAGVMFYAVLEGKAEVSNGPSGSVTLQSGDIVMVMSGEAHTVCCEPGRATAVLNTLHDLDNNDTPLEILLGDGRPRARVLCGNLEIRWPCGGAPVGTPALLALNACDHPVHLAAAAQGPGASSVLTRMAALVFTLALRGHPELNRAFGETMVADPVRRALDLIRVDPFQPWTVDTLASRVGMGRASFAARFTNETGKTPMGTVTEERMSCAARLIESTDLRISEISAQIGYRSAAAFGRRFASQFGVAPGRMRDRFRQAALGARLRNGRH
jgi:AraC family transcriptional activator of mtrCDE